MMCSLPPQLPPSFDGPKSIDQPNPGVEIQVKGSLDDTWSDWLLGPSINQLGEEEPILIGPVADLGALFGFLLRLRDPGVALLAATLSEEAVETAVHRADENRDLDPSLQDSEDGRTS